MHLCAIRADWTRTSQVQRKYHHDAPVNDAVIHPNQGELISCDQAGSVKIWDLGENICTHELVPDEDMAIRTVTIASDGGTLVAGNDNVGPKANGETDIQGMCYVWKIHSSTDSEATTLQPVTSFAAHPGKYITRCVLSPDTKWVPLFRSLMLCSSQTFGDVLGRLHRTIMVNSQLRVYAGKNLDGASEMGLGCCIQCRLGLSGHW